MNIAARAGVRQLILTHHAPYRTDAEVDRILAAAAAECPGVRAATDNMNLCG